MTYKSDPKFIFKIEDKDNSSCLKFRGNKTNPPNSSKWMDGALNTYFFVQRTIIHNGELGAIQES